MSDQLSMFAEPLNGDFDAAHAQLAHIPDVRAHDARVIGHDAFFAVLPTAAGAAMIIDATRPFALGGKAMDASRLHVSLFAVVHYREAFPRDTLAAAIVAASRVRHPAFEVAFDRVARFGSDGRAVVLKAEDDASSQGFHDLRAKLGAALADVGQHVSRAKPTPHMTVAWGDGDVPETPVEPVRWRAHELVLIDSHVGAHRHEVLGRWPLVG